MSLRKCPRIELIKSHVHKLTGINLLGKARWILQFHPKTIQKRIENLTNGHSMTIIKIEPNACGQNKWTFIFMNHYFRVLYMCNIQFDSNQFGKYVWEFSRLQTKRICRANKQTNKNPVLECERWHLSSLNILFTKKKQFFGVGLDGIVSVCINTMYQLHDIQLKFRETVNICFALFLVTIFGKKATT